MQRTSSRDSLFSTTSDAPCSETFYLGDQCKLADNRVGTVAFVGQTKFAPGIWVGLALEKPEGKNNGSVGGERYFECKENHGIFCRPSKLTKLNPASPLSPSLSNGPPSPALSVARSIASTTVATNKTRSIYARECGFDIGERVSIGGGKVGVLRFLDRINNELYAGVQLDRPLGCCDGVFNNVRYFKCNPLYGIFVRASTVKKCAKFPKPSTIEVRHTKTSTLRTWKGSQESLNSVGAGSICSSASMMNSPKYSNRFGPVKGTLTRNNEIEAGLKNCLQEKEAHLEHLSKELELHRAETDHMAQQNSEFSTRNQELTQLLEEAKCERAEFERKFNELDERNEELTFQLDEALVQKSMFEAEANDLKAMCKELSEKLDANVSSSEVSQTAKKIDTAEFGVQVELLSDPKLVVCEEKCNLGMQTEVLARPDVKLAESQTEQISYSDFSSQIGVETSDANCEAFGTKCDNVGFQTDACDKVYANSGSQTAEDEEKIIFATSSSQTDDVRRVEINSASSQTDPIEEKKKVMMADCGVQVHYPSSQSAEVQTEVEEIPPSIFTVEIGSQASEDVQSAEMQTEIEPSPILTHFSSQTDSIPEKPVRSFEVQTDRREATNIASQTDSVASAEHCSREIQTEPEKPTPSIATSDSVTQTNTTQRNTTECQTTPPATTDFAAQISPSPASVKSVSTREAQTTKVTSDSSQVQTDPITPPKICTTEFGVQVLLKSSYVHSEVQTMAPSSTGSEEPPNSDDKRGIVELDVSKLVASANAGSTLFNGGGERVSEIENMLKERDEKVEQLDSTVSFLNSIISEQTTTIGKLRKELESNKPSDSNDADLVDRLSNGMRSRIRAYCDFCQTFDAHETRACPAEAERLAELTKHTTISPSLPQNVKRSKVVHRPFCDICEAFVHETAECPNSSPNRALKKW